MRIEVKSNGSSVVVLGLNGRLTAGSGVACLRDALDKILERDTKHVVLNMSRVDRVDCAGIGQLVASYSRIRTRGGGLKLAAADRRLRSLLELFRLDSVLEVWESEQSAVASLVLLGNGRSTQHKDPIATHAPRPAAFIPVT